MTKEEILGHPAWKYIESLSPSERYTILFEKMNQACSEKFGCSIYLWGYGRLGEVDDSSIALAVKDNNMSIMAIAVLTPKY